jgi:hypothetical protein
LDGKIDAAADYLNEFNHAEMWESAEFINGTYAPIASGDVFELDRNEKLPEGTFRRYILLTQPCDIALRPDGKRGQAVAMLIPLKPVKGEKEKGLKELALPFKLDDQDWLCDTRNVGFARIAILDLASFRSDGCVRLDEGHAPPKDLLAAQEKVYDLVTAAADEVLKDPKLIGDGRLINPKLQLIFDAPAGFNQVRHGAFVPAVAKTATTAALPNRVTWKMRRCGRLRTPFAAILLDEYYAVAGRPALDLKFVDVKAPGAKEGQEAPVVAEGKAAATS